MQRNFHDYEDMLEFKEECVLEFPVVQVGNLVYGNTDEFYCIRPVPGMNLWVDKQLTLLSDVASTSMHGVGIGFVAEGGKTGCSSTKSIPEIDDELENYNCMNDTFGFDGSLPYFNDDSDDFF